MKEVIDRNLMLLDDVSEGYRDVNSCNKIDAYVLIATHLDRIALQLESIADSLKKKSPDNITLNEK